MGTLCSNHVTLDRLLSLQWSSHARKWPKYRMHICIYSCIYRYTVYVYIILHLIVFFFLLKKITSPPYRMCLFWMLMLRIGHISEVVIISSFPWVMIPLSAVWRFDDFLVVIRNQEILESIPTRQSGNTSRAAARAPCSPGNEPWLDISFLQGIKLNKGLLVYLIGCGCQPHIFIINTFPMLTFYECNYKRYLPHIIGLQIRIRNYRL